MTRDRLYALLTQVQKGSMSVERALTTLKQLPFQDLGFARVDYHRALRKGFPEVIWGPGKTSEQIAAIAGRLTEQGQPVLITRLEADQARVVRERLSALTYHTTARVGTLGERPTPHVDEPVFVLSAGTADMPVAEEAAVCAEWLGNRVERLYDVGVAGLHRLLDSLDRLAGASVVIVVAGMEGALPSVVGGLIDKPIIAVPTGIGYGASFGGVAALLGMLNSCAAGVTVVNIDNGFGAAAAAASINQAVARLGRRTT